jgi:hypothetical protein
MPLTNFFKSGGRRGSNATDSPNGSLDSEEGVMEPESPTTRLGKRKRSDSDKSEGKGRAPGGAPGVGQAKSNAIEAVGTLTPPPTSPVKRTHDVLGQNPHQPSPKARRQVIATNDENDEYPVSSDEELGLSVLFERSSARVIQENSIADFREHGSTGRSGNSDAFYMPRSADLPTARMIDWEGNNKRLKVSEKSVSFQESNASSEQSASSRSNVHQMIEPIMSTLLHPDYVNDDKLKSARAQLEMISRQFRCLESTKNSLRSARMTKDIEIKNLRAKVAKMEAELNKANDEINDMKGGLITLYSKH